MRVPAGLSLLVVLLFTGHVRAAEVVVDCAAPAGTFRPLHGVNGGPLDRGGLVDLSDHIREVAIPLARLHDCHWPNPDVVDVHVVFPDFSADPARPESYDFVRTDAYLKALVATGSKIVYRLGESIEHGPDKRRQRPPADPEKWAAVCAGIVRHYNGGWASGYRYGIRFWEIWNEPDNRPNCWTGSDEEYFRLYAAAARAIRKEFPDVKVGGPAVGNVGRVEMHRDGVDLLRTGPEPLLVPSPFVQNFLEFCKREAAPLDFFSWHLYCDGPAAVVAHAGGVRRMLDRAGLEKTESHLNEWSYLPGNDWGPVLLSGQGEKRRAFYDRVGGAEGAAFAAAVLVTLQDCPVDAANYFNADTGEFGLFDRYGVPRKTFYAFKAFRSLLATPVRLKATCDTGGTTVAAGTNAAGDAVGVLIACRSGEDDTTLTLNRVPPEMSARCRVFTVDAENDFHPAEGELMRAGGGQLSVRLRVRPPGVVLVTLIKG